MVKPISLSSWVISWNVPKIFGLGEGNQITLGKLIQQKIIPKNSPSIFSLNTYIRTCEMTSEQLIGVIKEWCDNNPKKNSPYVLIHSYRGISFVTNQAELLI